MRENSTQPLHGFPLSSIPAYIEQSMKLFVCLDIQMDIYLDIYMETYLDTLGYQWISWILLI